MVSDYNCEENPNTDDCKKILETINEDQGQNTYTDFKNIKYSVLNPAVTYINDHFSEKDLDATLLHEMCDLSYTHFKRLFINQFGVSPKKYIITQRMNLAHKFLSSGQYSISEVAELCGYDNPYYFSNAFKSHFGYSPSQCK
jgi:AraC-like DNA-binding protein